MDPMSTNNSGFCSLKILLGEGESLRATIKMNDGTCRIIERASPELRQKLLSSEGIIHELLSNQEAAPSLLLSREDRKFIKNTLGKKVVISAKAIVSIAVNLSNTVAACYELLVSELLKKRLEVTYEKGTYGIRKRETGDEYTRLEFEECVKRINCLFELYATELVNEADVGGIRETDIRDEILVAQWLFKRYKAVVNEEIKVKFQHPFNFEHSFSKIKGDLNEALTNASWH